MGERSSSGGAFASRQKSARKRNAPPPIALHSDARRENASSRPGARRRPGASSTTPGSKQERVNEIPGRQTIDCDRRAQNQRESRGRVLEGTERDRGGPERD